jgi:hypothetical protein
MLKNLSCRKYSIKNELNSQENNVLESTRSNMDGFFVEIHGFLHSAE